MQQKCMGLCAGSKEAQLGENSFGNCIPYVTCSRCILDNASPLLRKAAVPRSTEFQCIKPVWLFLLFFFFFYSLDLFGDIEEKNGSGFNLELCRSFPFTIYNLNNW